MGNKISLSLCSQFSWIVVYGARTRLETPEGLGDTAGVLEFMQCSPNLDMDAVACGKWRERGVAGQVPGGWRSMKTSIAVTALQFLLGGGGSFSSGGPGQPPSIAPVSQPALSNDACFTPCRTASVLRFIVA